MATIPLYDTTVTEPGAWRHVTAPGGYQWWRVDVVDGEKIASIILHDGQWNSRKYCKSLKKFRWDPIRKRPPAPSDFRAVQVFFISDEINTSRQDLIDSAAFEASPSTLHVRMGDYELKTIRSDYQVTGPEIDLKLVPIGTDGSLHQAAGTIFGKRIDGRGVVRSAFEDKPTKEFESYCILYPNRAVIGAMKDERAFELDGADGRKFRFRERFDLQLRQHDGWICASSTYVDESDAAIVAIVDYFNPPVVMPWRVREARRFFLLDKR